MGATRTRAVHVTLPSGDVITARVYDVIDAVADPDLAQRLMAGEPINRIAGPDGSEVVVTTPVVFHDPAAEVFVVVASASDRHRELELRAQTFTELAADRTAAVPAYVRDFGLVFGAAGLTALLEARAGAALSTHRAAEAGREVERERRELGERRAELATREAALEQHLRELEARQADLAAAGAEAARRLVEADRDATRLGAEAAELRAEAAELRAEAERELTRARAEGARSAIRPSRPTPGAPTAAASEPVTTPVRSLTEVPDEVTSPFEMLEEADAPELPSSADPITTVTADAPRPGSDPWVLGFARSTAPAVFSIDDDGRVRVALRAGGTSGAALTASRLDVRLVVHRLPEYGVIALVIGTPAALRGVGPSHRVVVPLDVAGEVDRRFLAALERDFTIEVDVIVDGRPVRRARLQAPLTENVGFVLRAASDHLRALGASANFARGLVALGGSGLDLLGLAHPEHGEFRVDKLEPMATANQARRALAIARRFSRPAREDYLACVRSFPLTRWRELRRAVLARAIELGLWMGPELAQTAVSEGLARSRRDLLARLEAGFANLLGQAQANDLDADAIEDNRKALADEATALGVASATSASAEDEPATSGTIAAKPTAAPGVRGLPVPELVRLLDDRDRRLAAALELCERGDGTVARLVMNAVRRMSRADAVRVLGAMVRLGPTAAPTLTAGLASSKAFLRHGCALALALLHTEAGTEAVVDALLGEPTEIWREIARAVGHVGPPALMPLAARLGRLGDRASAGDRERIAWAMAHVGVRGGKHAVETLANGHSAVAPVARMAIERMAPAASDDVSGRSPGREVTVNRAFSRRFFEALERGLPELGKGELAALDASSPMELLDDSDLVPDDDGGDEELDESDLVDE
ncbi:MAG: hypothetical protein IPL61_10885 [Myxococcales bacterium]|nr:hypothetical protein [Myxococcales bacterium]